MSGLVSGIVGMRPPAPAQPLVIAHNSGTHPNVTGDATVFTVDYDTEVTDQNGDFDTDTFTAPVTGSYLISGTAEMSSIDGDVTGIRIQVIASTRTGEPFLMNLVNSGTTSVNAMDIGGTLIMDMDANDTVTMALRVVGQSPRIVDVAGSGFHTAFCAMMLA